LLFKTALFFYFPAKTLRKAPGTELCVSITMLLLFLVSYRSYDKMLCICKVLQAETLRRAKVLLLFKYHFACSNTSTWINYK